MDQKKQGVFDRISSSSTGNSSMSDDVEMEEDTMEVGPSSTQTARLSGLGPINSSVFSRLGPSASSSSLGSIDPMPMSSRIKGLESSKSSPGILKNPSPVKKRLVGNEIVSIKKVPAKAVTMAADELERGHNSIGQRLVFSMDHDQPTKSVKFSAEDEVVEIDARRVPVKPKLKNIRARLGAKQTPNGKASVLASLHATRKTIKLKGSGSSLGSRLGGVNNKVKLLKYGALRSEDLLEQTVASPSVHSRLDFHKKAESLAHRIQRVSLDNQKNAGGGGGLGAKKKSSVFNRLGFGSK